MITEKVGREKIEMSEPSARLISINRRSSSKMNASLYTNVTYSSSLLQIHPPISPVNDSLYQLILPPTKYCSFPAQHNHILSELRGRNPLSDYLDSLDADDEEDLTSAIGESRSKLIMSRSNREEQVKKNDNDTTLSDASTKRQLLDPYIDAVRVKNRVNNKRGERVKAMPSPRSDDFGSISSSSQVSSPTKKTYHILSHPGELHHSKNEWYTTDESDDDDEDEYGDDDKYKKVVKKIYLQEYPISKGNTGMLYDGHDIYHKGGKYKPMGMLKNKRKKTYGKKNLGKKKLKRRRKQKRGKKKKKIAYAYIYHSQPIKAYYEEHYEDNLDYDGEKYPGAKYMGKGKGNSYQHKHHDYHDDHHHKGSYMTDKGGYFPGKNKMSKYSMTDLEHKNAKFSVAGLLGYTILCINYLLLMHHPSGSSGSGYMKDHDSYHTHDAHSKYSPYAAASHLSLSSKMSPFSSGPVILAHCGELPEPRSLVKLHTHASEPGPNVTLPIKGLAAQIELEKTPVKVAARHPPAYHYTPSSNINQQPSSSVNRDTYIALNRILLPTDPTLDPAGEGVTRLTVRRPANRFREAELESPRRRLRVSFSGGGLSREPASRLLLEAERGDGLRLVRTRDNLVEMRRRNVDVRLRVHHRRNGLLVVRSRAEPLRLTEPQPLNLRARLGPIQVAVRAPFQGYALDENPNSNSSLMLADQGAGNRDPSSDANNNEMLDLPEFALAGDSIELTCNHRMPESRLYSVKWFKDSLEFYRFIPRNGPRTKSSLFLPDVRLDLARSDSETLYLRNVSHRTSGLYRCEAVSEGPDFETLNGEKRMQVYTLPEKGPQLSLLEPRDQQPSLSFTLRPPLEIALSALRGSTQLEQPEDLTEQLIANESPLVKCISARSSPASELRLLVNNQVLGIGRAIENSTLSYSDGTQANVVSFRLRLSDFTYDSSNVQQRNASALNKEASLDSFSSSKVTPNQMNKTSNVAREETDKDKNVAANAAVHFDDPSAPMREADFRGTRNQQQQQHQADAHKSSGHLVSSVAAAVGGLPFSRTDNGEDSKPEVGGVGRANSESSSSEEKSDDSLRKGAETRRTTELTLAANQSLLLLAREKRQTSSPNAGKRGSEDEAAGEQDDADTNSTRKGKEQEERRAARRPSSGGQLELFERGREREREQEQEQRQVYSSFIRIKCTSLVPAVGYEMTSELLAPLTLLVPSNQLTDAALDSVARGSPDKQLAARDSLRRQDGQLGMRAIRTGNSPRALVLIDRIAQASTPPASKLFPGAIPSAPSAASTTNNNTTVSTSLRPSSDSSSRTTKARTVAKTAREKALEEKAKYLDELSKRSKSGKSEFLEGREDINQASN